jgi:penicillin-insensitive murein endopeptidase
MRKLLIGGILALTSLVASTALAAAEDTTPAKTLFGQMKRPSSQDSQPVGSYAKGCLAGGVPLPISGPAWQVMRLSRNRNWGMPELVAYLEKFGTDARKAGDWPGLLIGDMSQPRGGPMATGHASHQIGLDVDVWYVPMPGHVLSANERETMSAVSLLVKGRLAVDPAKWSDSYARLLERAASYPEVTRIFVSPAIKLQLCDTAGTDRTWLRKLRPWSGHEDHFHVRLECPPGLATCAGQSSPPPGDGCGDDLGEWFKPHPPPPKPPKPVKPKPPLTLADLPKACAGILDAKEKDGTVSTN